jgi:glutathione S-transferase
LNSRPSDRAVDLAGKRDRGDALARAAQAVREVRELLAQRRRRRGLAVGARKHRRVGERFRHGDERLDHAVERGQQHAVARFLEHQGVGEVVDVLGGAREVHESRDARGLGVAREALLQPVLDRLDVVVGLRLDRLDLRRVVFGERRDQALERLHGVLRERLDLGNRRFTSEREQPADLDRDAVAEKRGFAEAGT